MSSANVTISMRSILEKEKEKQTDFEQVAYITRLIDTKGLAVLLVLLGTAFFYFQLWPFLRARELNIEELSELRLENERLRHAVEAEKKSRDTIEDVIAELHAERNALMEKLNAEKERNKTCEKQLAVSEVLRVDSAIYECMGELKDRYDMDWVLLFRRQNGDFFFDGGARTYYTLTHELTNITDLAKNFQRQPDSLYPWHNFFLHRGGLEEKYYRVWIVRDPKATSWFGAILRENGVGMMVAAPIYHDDILMGVIACAYYKRCENNLLLWHVLYKQYAAALAKKLEKYRQ